MVWDLRAALLRKGEVESARLDHFAFRARARTMRLLATSLGRDIDWRDLASSIAVKDDEGILADLLARFPDLDATTLRDSYGRCVGEANRTLIEEIGDPTPYRLA
jgi:hypothetical protein